jgi:hypothetical protein
VELEIHRATSVVIPKKREQKEIAFLEVVDCNLQKQAPAIIASRLT